MVSRRLHGAEDLVELGIDDALQLADEHYRAGRLELAEHVYGQILAAEPDHADAWHLLGMVALQRGELESALVHIARAIRHAPERAEFHNHLGVALHRAYQFAEAEAAYQRALAFGRPDPSVLANLASAMRNQGRSEEGLALTREALALDQYHAKAHTEQAVLLLTLGHWREGFKEYRWRLKLPDGALPSPPGEEWRGEPVDGRTVLLCAEQGLGDMIQFARFAPLVAAKAAKVVLVVRSSLARLLKTMPAPRVEIVPEGSHVLAYDLHAPLMSVPALLDLDLPDIPASVPYLFAEPERVARWRALARLEHGFRIGITWQGDPRGRIDQGRSFPIRCFERLAALPGVRLIALQKEHGLDQLGRLPPGMVVEQLGEDFDVGPDAFLDTAAVMASLDLVLTRDTAVAHLAGALGCPVWVVLRHGADWRWLQGREDSPWYSTMRLFRQDAFGDWGGAFAKVERALKELMAVRALARPQVPISWGELLDKITILEIKQARITDPVKLRNVRRELQALEAVRDAQPWRRPETEHLYAELRTVNEALWEFEDSIRERERLRDFGPRFVELARSVYIANDRRAILKRALNEALGSDLMEEKSYGTYG
jgi:hypothetical protein